MARAGLTKLCSHGTIEGVIALMLVAALVVGGLLGGLLRRRERNPGGVTRRAEDLDADAHRVEPTDDELSEVEFGTNWH